MLTDKRIVVTGGTGSLGKVLIRRLLSGELGRPRKIVVFSRDEAKQHEMRVDYLHRRVATDEVIYHNFQQLLEFRIGDVRDFHSVSAVLRDADVVFNAAALKQVPTCEYFPVRGGADQHRRPGEHRARDPRARPRRRHGRRHLHRQGLQAGERDGHDQGHPGAGLPAGQPRLPGHPLHVRALRQRARLAGLGHPALPRADPRRRTGDHHHARDDALPADPRTRRWTPSSPPCATAGPARPSFPARRPPWSRTSPRP